MADQFMPDQEASVIAADFVPLMVRAGRYGREAFDAIGIEAGRLDAEDAIYWDEALGQLLDLNEGD